MFYEVQEEPTPQVIVKAVGIKRHNELWIGEEKIGAMITIDLSKVAALVPHVQPGSREPVIVTHGEQAVAAVFPGSEEDVEDLLLSTNAQFQTILERSQRRIRIGGRHEQHGRASPA